MKQIIDIPKNTVQVDDLMSGELKYVGLLWRQLRCLSDVKYFLRKKGRLFCFLNNVNKRSSFSGSFESPLAAVRDIFNWVENGYNLEVFLFESKKELETWLARD